MKRFSIFLILIILGCFNPKEDTEGIILLADSEFLCPEYEVEDSNYSLDMPIGFNLSVIEIISDKLNNTADPVSVVDFANNGSDIYQGFNTINIYFELYRHKVEVIKNINKSPIRHRDLLRREWKNSDKESIVVVIVPDDMQIYEGEDVLGAAYNIPPLSGYNRAKPILFVKESHLFTGVFFHEMSHVFGLKHLFHNDDHFNEGYNCTQGDMAVDTPTPPMGSGVSGLCSYVPGSDSDTTSLESRKIFVSNYMGYIPVTCMNKWETGQTQIIKKIAYTNPLIQQTSSKIEEYDIFVALDSL